MKDAKRYSVERSVATNVPQGFVLAWTKMIFFVKKEYFKSNLLKKEILIYQKPNNHLTIKQFNN
jgi:hypothetical protein